MNDRHTEDLLRDALGTRADEASWTPTPTASVAGRARGVRRRRAGVAAGVAAAVALAVVVPTALLGGGSDDPGPADSASAGARPTIGYAVDDVYHYPDGQVIALPEDVTTVTPVADGLLVTTGSDRDDVARLQLVEKDGSARDVIEGLAATSSRPVLGTDGSWAATVIADDGSVTLVVEDAEGRRATTEGLGTSTLLLGIDGATGVVTYYTAEGIRQIDGYTRSHDYGYEGTLLPLPRKEAPPIDYSPADDLFTYSPDTAFGGAPAVVDSDGQFVWGGVGDAASTFSPSGRLVAGSGSEHLLEVRDAGGGDGRRAGYRVAVTIGTPPDQESPYSAVTWETDSSFVGTRRASGDLLDLVRLDLDGTVTPLRGTEPIDRDADLVWDTLP